jgi:ABC-type sulfate/molybdate transport systems ATPase subunit
MAYVSRSLFDDATFPGLDMKVQQELLRHADIQTTLNVNTQAVSADKREANSKVVRMVLLNTGQKQLWPARAMFEWFVTMESG